MLHKRLLLALAACFLMASGAWADDIGYIDCNSHPDDTKVFGKARQSQDVVASVPCGERFTVLVYGFVFSRVETRDGKIGFIFSNLISVDHSGKTVLQPASERVAVPRSPSAAKSSAVFDGVQAAPAPATQATRPTPQPEPVVAQSAPVPAASPAPTPAPSSPASSPLPSSNASEIPQASAQPSPAKPAQPEPVTAQPAPAPASPVASAPTTPEPAAQPAPVVSEPVAPPASASPAAAPQPQPAPAEPVAPAAVRDASVRSSWERPLPGARQSFLVELYSGYSFARFTSAGSSTNLNGAMGSIGYNLKPWLQIVGDSSYNFVTVSGVKNILYGNHFGGRFFYHRVGRWGFTPFGEVLIGGSRLDTKVSGPGGYTTSTNCISYKAGGGIDIRVKRHWEVRLINIDYYRTTFGTNATQNNYWASVGVVLRLFGSGTSE